MGSIGEEVEKVFMSNLAMTYVHKGKEHKDKYHDDVGDFVNG